MKLLILSDLHLEVWRDQAPLSAALRTRPDVVVLAGDIDTGARGIAWADTFFADIPVVYVHGNHEAYGHRLDELQLALDVASQKTAHVHFLQMRELKLGSVRFLGCTLWTDFRLFGDDQHAHAVAACGEAMYDYERIHLASDGHRKLQPLDTEQLHLQHRDWLRSRLAEPFDGRTVVVTHMAPSTRSVTPEHADDMVSAAYASRLDDLVEQADVWIHGHMHDSLDYQLGRCRVLCNPLGYKNRVGQGENRCFRADLLVDS
ncbi:MAG: metallophosphoesterase [Lysobacterales bacterium 14-68-21]|nr:MAG: metallophosphoesterase [Xanthomonadales bacterium 14-68-21]